MTRTADALAIQQGASNPSGVARALVRAIDEFQSSPQYTGTDSVRSDPAIRLICHQLAFLLGVRQLDDDLAEYDRLVTLCENATQCRAGATT